MPIYEYETIPQDPKEEPVRFEVKQCMNDEPLTSCPDTGRPVRRVISGGLGYIAKSGEPEPSAGGCCGGGACCHS
jgi:predicted nucleic acid-binding Zn ribbon protein